MFVEFVCAGFFIYSVLFFCFTRKWTAVDGKWKAQDSRTVRHLEDILHLFHYGFFCAVPLYNWNTLQRWTFARYMGEQEPLAIGLCGAQLGSYIAMLFTVRVSPVKRDVTLMTFHHLITFLVVFLSVMCGYAHSCVVILLLHDLCDVPLFVMKLAGYARYKKLEILGYVAAVLGFICLRLIAFPWVSMITLSETFTYPVAPVIVCILLCLWAMHIWWLWMLLYQGYRKLSGLNTYDFREEEKKKATRKTK